MEFIAVTAVTLIYLLFTIRWLNQTLPEGQFKRRKVILSAGVVATSFIVTSSLIANYFKRTRIVASTNGSTVNNTPPITGTELFKSKCAGLTTDRTYCKTATPKGTTEIVAIGKPWQLANAALIADKEMRQYEPYTVTLKISEADLSKFLLEAKLDRPEAAVAGASGVLLSNFIQAELSADDFKIEARDKRLNLHKVDPNTKRVADWVWIVSPQSWGDNKKLTAHIYSLDDSKSEFVLNEVATKDVEVSVSVNKVGFLQHNADDIAKLILLPLFGFALKQLWDWNKNRKSKLTESPKTSPLPVIPVEEQDKRQA